jgi:hypothetical protein
LLLNSLTLLLGEAKKFSPMVSVYVLSVVNDLVFSLQAARQRRWQTLRVVRVGRRVARDLVLSRRNPQVAIVNAGKSPITGPGLDGLVARAVRKRLLSETKDASRYLDSCAITIVCVGTPSASKDTRRP